MRQTKNEGTIREWVEKTFTIDTGQRRNLLTPKPVIREIAKKHASMQRIMATVAGERHVDRETRNVVQSMLDCVSTADIDTEATYHTDKTRPRSSRYKKVRCVRHIFPFDLSAVSDENLNKYSTILERSQRAVWGETDQSRVATDNEPDAATHLTRVGRQNTPTNRISCVTNTSAHSDCDQDFIDGIAVMSHSETINIRDNGSHSNAYDTSKATHNVYNREEEWIIVIELYAGSASMVRQMMKSQYSHRVLALIVDVESKEKCGVDDIVNGITVFFEQFDLANLTANELRGWCKEFFGTGTDKICRIHASFCCETFAYINMCNPNAPRDKDGIAISDKALKHNKMLQRLIDVLDDIHNEAPAALLTIENPAHSSFAKCPIIDTTLAKDEWQLLRGDHCANADPILDGAIYGTKYHRKGGLFSKKPTNYMTKGIAKKAKLNRCAGRQCPMKVPNTDHHVLVVAEQANTGKPMKGQRKAEEARKAMIPLGVHDKILSAHIQWLNHPQQPHDDSCTKCGKQEGSSESSKLLRCTRTGCTRVQHTGCSDFHHQQFWRCNSCRYLAL